MNTFKILDKILTVLYDLNKSNPSVTINDLKSRLPIEDFRLNSALEFLIKKDFVAPISNAYKIKLEGEFFIENSIFFMKKRPFLYNKWLEQIKVVALTVNSIVLLILSILTYQHSLKKDSKGKDENQKIIIIEKEKDTHTKDTVK